MKKLSNVNDDDGDGGGDGDGGKVKVKAGKGEQATGRLHRPVWASETKVTFPCNSISRLLTLFTLAY